MTEFNIGDLLSVSTGLMLSPTGVGGVYQILNHLTGDNLMTHQLPEAMRVCEPYLLSQHPFLVDLRPAEGLGIADLEAWLEKVAAQHGEMHEVTRLAPEVWGVHDPIADLLAMTNKPIAVVVADSAQQKGQSGG